MKPIITVCIILSLCLNTFSQDHQTHQQDDYLITISTPYGDIKALLYEDTPQHRKNFLSLVKMNFYDGIIFHRVIDRFMIQGGDPNTRPGGLTEKMKKVISQQIPPEISAKHPHHRGAIGAARRNNDVNPYKLSNPSQFYIIENHKGAHHLDGKYTVFGQVMSGLSVIDSVAAQATNSKDRPLEDIPMYMKIDTVKKKDVELFYNYQYPE